MNENKRQEICPISVFGANTTGEILDVMRHEKEVAERQRILEGMTPAFREKLEYFEAWMRAEAGHTLRTRYELGLRVREVYEDEKNHGGSVYGKNAIGRICKLLGWEDDVIRLSLRFVRAFTPGQLERLCSLVTASGGTVCWSHVRTLLQVEAAHRHELLDRTVAEGWMSSQLALEVKRLIDRPGADGRGRPPVVPRDFDGAVANQQKFADEWDRRYGRVWGVTERSLATHAAKLPNDEVTEGRLRQAGELAVQLRRVSDQALEQAVKAEEIVRDFERILDLRKWAKTPSVRRTTA